MLVSSSEVFPQICSLSSSTRGLNVTRANQRLINVSCVFFFNFIMTAVVFTNYYERTLCFGILRTYVIENN